MPFFYREGVPHDQDVARITALGKVAKEVGAALLRRAFVVEPLLLAAGAQPDTVMAPTPSARKAAVRIFMGDVSFLSTRRPEII